MNHIPALTVSAIPFPQSAIRNPLFPLPASPCLRVSASSSLALSHSRPLPLRRSLLPFLLSIFYFSAFLSSGFAAPPTPPAVAAKLPAGPDLPAMVRSDDPQQQKQALALMHAQLEREGKNLKPDILLTWIDSLRQSKMNDPAMELAQRGLSTYPPKDTRVTIRLLGHKTMILLDQGKKDDALALMRQAFGADAGNAVATMDEQKWVAPLVSADLLPQTLALIDQTTLTRAGDLKTLERLLALRVNALLSAGKAQDALASAKSLYNVSSMTGTAKALSVVATCLQAAHPEDRDLLIRFRDQQIAGTAPSTTQRAAAPPTILGQIKVSAALYEKPFGNNILPTMDEEDFGKLTRAGNLLLLADRPLDAKLWFEQAYRVCNNDQLPYATESLARALKAEDGTIGRANAFLLALRPTKPAPK